MAPVFIVSDNILSPLGATTARNFEQLKNGISGVKEHQDTAYSEKPFYASLFDKASVFVEDSRADYYTKFEQLLIASITDAISDTTFNITDKKNLLIISSAKGNISLLENTDPSPQRNHRIALTTSAKLIANHFKLSNQPLIVSNACISGVLGIIIGMRLIQSGQYENVIVAGADVISKFVLSGFESFQATSQELCKPFDANRKGINLGEGAATIVLSAHQKMAHGIEIKGGAISNDANHISGPSRTGKELYYAMSKAMQSAKLSAEDIDFISAHGTATLYNDEMEAKAINLAGMQSVPVNSLKGYYGHTLGAAGLIESIITAQSMKEGLILPTIGFEKIGVSMHLTLGKTMQRASLTNSIKTASGFGGCNAAVVFGKH